MFQRRVRTQRIGKPMYALELCLRPTNWVIDGKNAMLDRRMQKGWIKSPDGNLQWSSSKIMGGISVASQVCVYLEGIPDNVSRNRITEKLMAIGPLVAVQYVLEDKMDYNYRQGLLVSEDEKEEAEKVHVMV